MDLDPITKTTLRREKSELVAKGELELFKQGLAIQFDAAAELTSELAVLRNKVAALETKPARAEVTLHQAPAPAEPKATQHLPKMGESFAAAAAAEFKRRVDQTSVSKTVAEIFPGDDYRLAREWATKAATQVAGSEVSGWALEITQRGVGEFWRELPDTSILRQMLAAGAHQPDLTGLKGLMVPIDNSTLKASWVAENSTIPHVSGQLSSATLNVSKLALLASWSNELAKSGSTSIARIIRANGLEAIDAAISEKLLSADAAVAGLSPAGLLINAPSQASVDPLTDAKFLLGTMVTNKARNMRVLLNPLNTAALSMVTESGVNLYKADLERGLWYGMKIIVSHAVPADQIIALDLDRLMIWAALPPEIDISQEATIVMIDADGSNPTMTGVNKAGSVHVSDAAGVTGGPAEVRSAFQTYAQVLRLVQPVSWAWIKPSAAVITSVDYLS